MSDVPSSSDRISAAYKRLVASAEVLHAASDEFSEPIAQLDRALHKLNLAVTTWKRVIGEDDGVTYWSRDVGYARIKGKWCLAIRTVRGAHHLENDDIEEWAFNEAPNSMRIEALDKLPDVLEQLIKSAEKTARKLKEKVPAAREIAGALKKAAQEIKAERERQ